MTITRRAQITNRMVTTGNYRTHIMEGGDPTQETIIFLHGSGPGVSAKSNWEYVLPEFIDRFHVIAPDLYGFGRTDHPGPDELPKNGVEWMRARLDQVLALMDTLNIVKAHLVGNSLGGVIALHLVMEEPKRFGKVVLMGAGGGYFQPTIELMKLQNFHKDPNPKAFANLLRWFVYDDNGLEEQIEEIVKERLELFMRPEVRRSYESTFHNANLADISIPPSAYRRMKHQFLLLHGQEDRFVPLESSLTMMEHIPNGQLHVFAKTGHWVQIEQKERFVKLTKDFFNDDL